jgi:hypothetical protein
MKNRQEMIYDFMLALSANSDLTPPELQPHVIAEMIYQQASVLADQYLENL